MIPPFPCCPRSNDTYFLRGTCRQKRFFFFLVAQMISELFDANDTAFFWNKWYLDFFSERQTFLLLITLPFRKFFRHLEQTDSFTRLWHCSGRKQHGDWELGYKSLHMTAGRWKYSCQAIAFCEWTKPDTAGKLKIKDLHYISIVLIFVLPLLQTYKKMMLPAVAMEMIKDGAERNFKSL